MALSHHTGIRSNFKKSVEVQQFSSYPIIIAASSPAVPARWRKLVVSSVFKRFAISLFGVQVFLLSPRFYTGFEECVVGYFVVV